MNPVVHFEMPASDKGRMIKFYEKAFGWKMQQLGPEMGNYVVVSTTETDEKNRPKTPGRKWDRNSPHFLKNMVEIRKASLPDIPAILSLINAYAGQGIMLPRTEFELAENIRDFIVAVEDSEIVGCGALHFYTPRSAEVRSLSVSL